MRFGGGGRVRLGKVEQLRQTGGRQQETRNQGNRRKKNGTAKNGRRENPTEKKIRLSLVIINHGYSNAEGKKPQKAKKST